MKPTSSPYPPKAIDLIVDGLRQAIKTVDASIAVALTVVTVLVAWGAQGDFERWTAARTTAAAAARAASAASSAPQSLEPQVDIPWPQVKVQLDTAAVVGFLVYWIFLIRAGVVLRRATTIAAKLQAVDPRILEAALAISSIVTANRAAQIALVVGVIGTMGALSDYLFLSPATGLIGKSPWPNVLFMYFPAIYLAFELQVWRRRVLSNGAA
jgi:hypothetical protein